MTQWDSNVSVKFHYGFCLWSPPWPLIQALVYRSSFCLTPSPIRLSPIPCSLSSRTHVYSTSAVSYAFPWLEWSLKIPQSETGSPLTTGRQAPVYMIVLCVRRVGLIPVIRVQWAQGWHPHPTRGLDVGVVSWNPFHEEWWRSAGLSIDMKPKGVIRKPVRQVALGREGRGYGRSS